ncbi:MAG: tetratricopeptide repeat protein [Bdellovibrionales bacterium]
MIVPIERCAKPAIAALFLLALAIIVAGPHVWANDPPAADQVSNGTTLNAQTDISIKASRLLPPSPSQLSMIRYQSGLPDPAVASVVDKLGQMGQPSALKTPKPRAKISLSPRHEKTPSPFLTQSWQALQTGDGLAALRAIDRALAQTPNNPDALNLKAYILAHMDRHEHAIETLCRLLEHDPQNAEALRNLAIELGLSTAPQALKELEDMAAADPSSAPVQASLARQYARLQDEGKALTTLDRAVRLAPQNLAYRVELASLYDRYGYPSEAATLYRQALETASARRELGENDSPAITPELLRVIRARADHLARRVKPAHKGSPTEPLPDAALPKEYR